MQEALLTAALRWPRDGMPPEPRAWLTQTATRRLIDQWRSDRSRRQREVLAASQDVYAQASDEDDSLTLLFVCCHPALSPASAIALTLRAVGGLSTAEIARAFLVDEMTMGQRISRAKQRIKASGTPFRMPAHDEYASRLRSVLHVLYLMFNEGYARSAGDDLQRTELLDEAVRLTRLAQRLLPDDPEVAGLLALMLLIDARRPARVDEHGDLVPLAEQDRSLWNGALIAAGGALLNEAMARGAVGEYQLQAAIAAIHSQAKDAADTDWRQIHELYVLLERMTGNPIVTLNRAVAAAMADGPEAGIAVVDGIAGQLNGHHRVDAVRAHLLEMAGENEAAIESYAAAASRATNLRERRYLTTQAARLRTEAAARPPRHVRPDR